MRSPRLAITTAMTLTALTMLAACGSASDTQDEPDTTPSSSTSSSPRESPTSLTSPTQETRTSDDGDSMTGTGYTVALPSDWQDATELAKQKDSRVDIALAEAVSGGFRTNFNTVQPYPLPTKVSAQQLAAQAAKELESVTHTAVTPVDGQDFDGSSSIGQTSSTTASGFDVTLIQYLVVRDHKVYATTMTFETSRADEAKATLDEIVGSWTWTT